MARGRQLLDPGRTLAHARLSASYCRASRRPYHSGGGARSASACNGPIDISSLVSIVITTAGGKLNLGPLRDSARFGRKRHLARKAQLLTSGDSMYARFYAASSRSGRGRQERATTAAKKRHDLSRQKGHSFPSGDGSKADREWRFGVGGRSGWEKRKKTRVGRFKEVMQARCAPATQATPVSRRRCVHFLKQKSRQAKNKLTKALSINRNHT